ncbi:protein PALS2 [Hetaerina americana]|uniref:protein PALS2 n=1 Tax=Hetaerina americana TaxID=62018 RepID=UPI003A7F2DDA
MVHGVLGRRTEEHRRLLTSSIDGARHGDSLDNGAFQRLGESQGEIEGSNAAAEDVLVAKDTDLIFLRGLIDAPERSIAKEKIEEFVSLSKPECLHAREILKEVQKFCKCNSNRQTQELARILVDLHIGALIETHDLVAELQHKKELEKVGKNSSGKVNSNNSSGKGLSSDSSTGVSAQTKGRSDSIAVMPADTVRMVGLRKKPNEPLGLTVVETDWDGRKALSIARILAGGSIDSQGLLHVGDVITEVNGVIVTTPMELQELVASAGNYSINLKVIPNGVSSSLSHSANLTSSIPDTIKEQCYLRALFSYDPAQDTLLPCKDIGLPFTHGDVLQILNKSDPNWWQARKVYSRVQNGDVDSHIKSSLVDVHTGLIPSLELEERRKAFVKPEADYVHKIGICGTRISKKKRKTMYQSKQNCEFDRAELLLYEEVTRMPPFRRKTLALVGSHGVGRRTLKNRLINSDPEKFGTIIPVTSRPPRELEENGRSYWFMDREEMESDIREHGFLEYGEHNGHLYGTKLDSIRQIIRQGKMCILDCSPNALKILHNSSEFMPYVIFVAAPGMEQLKHLYDQGRHSSRNLTFDRASSIRYSSRRARTLESLASLYEEEDLRRTLEESSCLQRTFEKYIDEVIVNDDFDTTFRKVLQSLEALSTEHQWVPLSWVY